MPKTIKHILFLKWWLFISAVVAASAYGVFLGGAQILWDNDTTKLSVLLVGLFVFMSGWCGLKTWKISRILDQHRESWKSWESKRIINRIDRLMEVGWFTSDLCLSIGMLGTVIGFILMLSGFTQLDMKDTSTVQGLITGLGSGMSTALYTTMVGLTCSSLLKIQYFNLNQAIDKVS